MSSTVKSAGSATLAFSLTLGMVAMLAEEPAQARSLVVTAPVEAFATEQVSTAGLDLASARDVRRLKTRIFEASQRVCATSPHSLPAGDSASCARAAQERAATQIASLAGEARRLADAGLPSELVASIAVVASAR